MPPLSVMIKPASSLCNMRCAYCFYHSLSTQREVFSYGVMDMGTVENLLKKGAAFTNGAPFHIAFQGGEPTLAGLDFFRAFTARAKELAPASPITYALQTNGSLIDDEWASFFKKNGFLIGLSLDGDPENNAYRVDADNRYTTERVLHAAQTLSRHGVPFNILSVVTKKTAERVDAVMRFYREHDFRYLQFIPCLRPFGVPADPYAMDEEEYVDFLVRAWQHYAAAFFSPRPLSIRFFDNLLHMALGEEAEQCGLQGHCNCQFVIEGNGDVFPCDFYCLDEWKMGNINEQDYRELAQSDAARKFMLDTLPVRPACKQCRYWRLCLGGCRRYLDELDWCGVMKGFFGRVLPSLHRIATLLQAQKKGSTPPHSPR